MATPFVKAEPGKGDIVVHTSKTEAVYVAVGADGYVPIADSIEDSGIKWGPAPTSGGSGVETVDFGGGAGSNDANVVISGLTSFVAASSTVTVWIHCIDAAVNDWRDHRDAVFLGLVVVATEFVDGDGFTIYAHTPVAVLLTGLYNVAWSWR